MDDKKQTDSHPWLKQLLVSIIGTSIGVGLTFTANRCVDNYKQRNAKRETAIMAVCDIDEIVRELREEIHLEDSLFQVTMYVSTHQEQIDSLSIDTIDMAFDYLYDNPMRHKEWTSDTKENAFNSGIDARMNLGNNQFYDNVQLCYYARRSLIRVMQDAPVFRKPVRKEDYEIFLQSLRPSDIDQSGNPVPDARRWVLKQIFAQGSTALYIRRFFARKDAYSQIAYRLERLNNENKLLMNITDGDIEKYIRENSEKVLKQASADLIIGKWEFILGDNSNYYEFRKDNSSEATFRIVFQLQLSLFEEQNDAHNVFVISPMTFRMNGRWELNGDTLITDYDSDTAELISFDLDTSNFPQAVLDSLKDSLEIEKEMAKNFLFDEIMNIPHRSVFNISFDKSGRTMVWKTEETTPSGKKQTVSYQVYRRD